MSDFDIVKSQQNYHGLPRLFATVQILCKSTLTDLFEENSDSLNHGMYYRELGESTVPSNFVMCHVLAKTGDALLDKSGLCSEDMTFADGEPCVWLEPTRRAV